jgi:hypothetical protein
MVAAGTSVGQNTGKHCSGIFHGVPGNVSDSDTGPFMLWYLYI